VDIVDVTVAIVHCRIGSVVSSDNQGDNAFLPVVDG
jgi:hypothetical protein